MKINHHEPENFNKKDIKSVKIEVNIPENTQNLKKYNKNVDNSGIVNGTNGAKLLAVINDLNLNEMEPEEIRVIFLFFYF